VLTDDAAAADVVVVNTCDFIGPATAESREAIRQAARLKRTGRCRRLVVAGCMAQRRREALFRDVPEIDAVVGVFERDRILDACRLPSPSPSQGEGRGEGEDPDTSADRMLLVGEPHAVAPDVARFRLTPRHTAYLRIAEGCDNRCTYCVIPSIRGPLRSKSIETILAEARELAADGAKELNLIAQDTCRYGSEKVSGTFSPDTSATPRLQRTARQRYLTPCPTIVDLLRELQRVKGVRWLRLLYAHPAHVTDDLIDHLARSRTVCRYLDLPLQHASDSVLERMGRHITGAQVRDLIGRLRRRIPGLTLRTTFIVGFPGETGADFDEVMDLVRETRFERLGAFAYSREPGTPAAAFSDQVAPDVIERRLHDLMTLQQHIAFEQNRALVGTRMRVLVDGPSPRFQGRVLARGQPHAPDIDGGVHVRGDLPTGAFRTVHITGWKDYDLLADVV